MDTAYNSVVANAYRNYKREIGAGSVSRETRQPEKIKLLIDQLMLEWENLQRRLKLIEADPSLAVMVKAEQRLDSIDLLKQLI